MGPRQDAGEDHPKIFPAHTDSPWLQWGPGRMPGKT